ncbi:helix-turn-helix domain-containing protein [Streptomyces aidingensis]|uniref:Helix-turn-helix domain-containing protein n=1 Tax=Streptomyces aidingensis TaxID=910347 RepID=A0A1I1PZG1_9ACTN|nr:helix-turn-helix transcriptional regulator [Streptomyces aidingensis]SFD15209.1 Helix-turn-helix domain-containing protein [Streptomyces aidingensis]
MGLRANPSQRQRRLGAELRRLRLDGGLTATAAGKEFGFSAAHVNNIEAGRTAIAPARLRALAELYGCKDERLIDALIAMSQSNGRGWWSEFRHPPHSDEACDLAELEEMSVRHRSFQWIHIPGLLQTEEYMRALFRGGQPDLPEESIERFVRFRMRRQRLLVEARAPELHAVVHEAALRMEFVGREVMRRQIEHLMRQATRLPHVRLQILPFRAEAYPPSFSCPFVCYDAAVPELSTVYIDHPTLSSFVIDQPSLVQFSDAFTRLSSVALPPVEAEAEVSSPARRDSFGLMQRLLYEL